VAQVSRTISIAAGFLASLLVAGCASQVVPTASAPFPSADGPTSRSTAPLSASPAIVPGGCGPTKVFTGPGPDAKGTGAIAGLAGLRWAQASPADAGITGYFFRPTAAILVVDPSLSGPSNKILWVTQGNLGGALAVAAHPAGSAAPVVHFSFPGAGRDYPSEIDLPTAGCWELDLGSSGAAINLVVDP
jgi:hypothetical protein